MVYIQKLGIVGIRSFSSSDVETLHLDKPLTLIVGQNGAGKTTILECMRVAITGEVPPNSNKGQNFLHDPRLLGLNEIKGQVRMILQKNEGTHIVIARNYTVSMGKDIKSLAPKYTFKANEALVHFVDAEGAQHSVNTKIADVNRILSEEIGVSKAVLNYVIFCHQEDSLWPLSESLLLKKRFDDIFASHRYTKTIEIINNSRKHYQGVMKEQMLTAQIIGKDLEQFYAAERKKCSFDATLTKLKEKAQDLKVQLEKAQSRVSEISPDLRQMLQNQIMYEQLQTQRTRLINSLNDEAKQDVITKLRTIYCNPTAVSTRLDEIRDTNTKIQDYEDKKSRLIRSYSEMVSEEREIASELGLTDVASIDDLMQIKCKLEDSLKTINMDLEMERKLNSRAKKSRMIKQVELSDLKTKEKERNETVYKLSFIRKEIQTCTRELEDAQSSISSQECSFERDDICSTRRSNDAKISEIEGFKRLEPSCKRFIELKKTISKHKGEIASAYSKVSAFSPSGSVSDAIERCTELRIREQCKLKMQFTNSIEKLRKGSTDIKSRLERFCDVIESGASNDRDDLTPEEIRMGIFFQDYPAMKGHLRELLQAPCQQSSNHLDLIDELQDIGNWLCNRTLDQENIGNSNFENAIGNLKSLEKDHEILTSVINAQKYLDAAEGQVEALQNNMKLSMPTIFSTSLHDDVENYSQYLNKALEIQNNLIAENTILEQREKQLRHLEAQRLSALSAVNSLNAKIEKLKTEEASLTSLLQGCNKDSVDKKILEIESELEMIADSFEKYAVTIANLEVTSATTSNNLNKLTAYLDKISIHQSERGVTISATLNTEIASITSKIESMHILVEKDTVPNLLALKSLYQLEEEIALKRIDLNELNRLKNLESALTSSIHETGSSLTEVETMIKSTQTQLNSALNDMNQLNTMYSGSIVAQKLRIDVEAMVVDQLLLDLGNYVKALEKAVVEYHNRKMDQINAYIKELWSEIYSGHDIDYIRIESNSENTARSYEYRVMMYKDGVDIPMRGRCSAGQKVIASLIIRLALAESFCTRCCIFTLDEPTTNLDAKNCESLAFALSKLVDLRKNYSHFQLVLITHDDAFVNILRTYCPMDHYYTVRKGHMGFSEIRQTAIRN